MPISGLVITLTDNRQQQSPAIAALGQHPAITLGTRAGARLPVVVDTLCDDEDRQIWEWLQALPGVQQVDVALIHFEESSEPERGGCTESVLAPQARHDSSNAGATSRS